MWGYRDRISRVQTPDIAVIRQVQEEMIRQVDTMVNAAARFRGLPKGHYDDRMALAMQWNKFPNLKDHAVSLRCVYTAYRK